MQSYTLSFCKFLRVKNYNHILLCFPHAADPPKIDTHPEGINAIVGQSVTFTIQPTGTEPLNYQWECKIGGESGGWQSCDVKRFPGANTSILTIPRVKKSNEGSYRCTISNCAGREISQCTTLTVG